jgi:hypothetical protein
MPKQIRVNKTGTLSMSPAVLRSQSDTVNSGFFIWVELVNKEEDPVDKISWKLYISDEAKGTPVKATYARVYYSNPRAQTGLVSVKRLLLDISRIHTILTGDETQVADFAGSYDVVRVTKSKFYIRIRRNENGKVKQSKQGTEETSEARQAAV